MAAAAKVPSFGLFAEGSSYTDRNRTPFEELWEALATRCGTKIALKVYGFTKPQIIAMNPPPEFPDQFAMYEKLDVFIQRRHDYDGFDNVIVAFDRIPKNDYLNPSCLRTEVNFLLKGLSNSETLQDPFRNEAAKLLQNYLQHPKTPRGKGRPPRGALDVIYMDPMFEGIFVSDEKSVLHGLGLMKKPKDWPSFDRNNQHPDLQILAKAVRLASDDVRRRIRGDLKSNKAGWAQQIFQQAPVGASLWNHDILQRLCLLVS